MGVAASNIFYLIFIQVPQDTLVNGRVTDVPPQPVEVPVVVDEVTKWILCLHTISLSFLCYDN